MTDRPVVLIINSSEISDHRKILEALETSKKVQVVLLAQSLIVGPSIAEVLESVSLDTTSSEVLLPVKILNQKRSYSKIPPKHLGNIKYGRR